MEVRPPSPDSNKLPELPKDIDNPGIITQTDESEKAIESLIPKAVADIKAIAKRDPKMGIKLSYMFILFLEAMNVKQSTLQQTAAKLNMNTATQEKLSKRQEGLKFEYMDPSKAKRGSDQDQEDYRTRLQNVNQRVENFKSVLQQMMGTLTQKSKITMTEASSQSSAVSQFGDQLSGIAKLIQKIAHALNTMTKR